MAAPLEKTRTSGVYKRGNRYVIRYRVNGKPQWESCRTYDEARRARRPGHGQHRGELQEDSRITLHEYPLGTKNEHGWIDRYQGTGRRGYRQETRDEDWRLLHNYALRYFAADVKLTHINPRTISEFVGWLCDPAKQDGRELADSTVRNALKPLRAALATARREGLIRHHPATDVALPHRERVEDDEDRPRPFPNGVMELVVSLIPTTWPSACWHRRAPRRASNGRGSIRSGTRSRRGCSRRAVTLCRCSGGSGTILRASRSTRTCISSKALSAPRSRPSTMTRPFGRSCIATTGLCRVSA
jgi:Phage integrase SAM-like domain